VEKKGIPKVNRFSAGGRKLCLNLMAIHPMVFTTHLLA